MKILVCDEGFIKCEKKYHDNNGNASIWVSSFVFDCMAANNFVGSFKFRNYRNGGERSTLTILTNKCSATPCNIVINVNKDKKGGRTRAIVNLLSWGVFQDGDIGLTIGGVTK